MARELAYVLINPYTIAKSRTGGVIARYMGRTDLNLVAARMFRPCLQLVQDYMNIIRASEAEHPESAALIADYILRCYAPNSETGRPRRVMLLLFEGEDAVRKIWDVTGSATLKSDSGQTIRDTYGDYILGLDGRVQYFEPAVLVAPTPERAAMTLPLWGRHSRTDGGVVDTATDVPQDPSLERTLVMLKPDNFRYRSSRPGNIIDVLSRSGLRIVAIKKFHMTVAQAEEFYGPVRQELAKRFVQIGAGRVAQVLNREFSFEVQGDVLRDVCERLGPVFAASQFEGIVEFMTGYRPSVCAPADKATLGKEECLALVYAGKDAVALIRSILGTTDPEKAAPGSVRREFGSNIMVNAAHASDSVESAAREMAIVDMSEDTVTPWIEKYYGPVKAA